MPTPAELKALIDDQITNKTLPYSVSNVDEGNLMKAIVDLGSNAVLAADLDVNIGAGQSVGGSVTGETFAAGATLESVLRDILIKSVPPVYVQPVAVLSENTNNPTGTASFESGSVLNPTFLINFSQNDAGLEASRRLLKNDVQIATSTPYTDTGIVIIDTPTIYKGEVTHLAGACKNNNLGVQDCTGSVAAGTKISNLLTYNGYRKAFYGDSAITPTTSAHVRALSGSYNKPIVGTQFTITIPIGTVKVVFAYPATLQDVASVKYVEFANTEIKSIFTMTLVNVAGNNNYSPISYKVFVYEPVEPFQTSATYTVTI